MSRAKKISLIFILLFLVSYSYSRAQEELLWNDCLKEAQKNNPDLISAQEQVVQKQADKEVAKSAIFPQVSVSVSASEDRAVGSSKSAKSYSDGVSASQLVFDAFKTVDNINTATENVKASKEAYRFTSSEIRLNLKTAFINLLKAQELLKVNKDIFEIRRSNLELITLRYESGLEHKGALLTAEANTLQAKAGIDRAKRDVEVSQHQLTKEMGRIKFTPIAVKGDLNLMRPSEIPDFTKLTESHPSLQNIIFQKNAARFSQSSAFADFFPEVSFDAGAGNTDTKWPPKKDSWNTGFSLSWPIFEGGAKTARFNKAKSLLRDLEAQERSTRYAVYYNLELTWNNLQDTLDIVDVQQKLLEATIARAKISEGQYSMGLISFDNWTIIQDDLVNTKTTLLAAEASALLAEASWIQAKGETLEYAQ